MTSGLVTVVVPVFKTEKYLDRCINSIVEQTYNKIEIILVDDGSPDRCPEMCNEWAKKDDRVKVVHKENAGLGFARNTGIENATGEYICFFDSDDYVAPDTIEKAYKLAQKEKSEIVIFGMCIVNSRGEIIKEEVPQTDKLTYVGSEIQEEFLPDLISSLPGGNRKNFRMSACASLFSISLIKKAKWRFASEREIISEDVYSLLSLYKYVDRVSVLSEALYFYCENASSLTHTYRPDRFRKICEFHSKCEEKARELGYNEKVIQRLQGPLASFVIAAMKQIIQTPLSEKDKFLAVKEIVHSDYLKKIQWNYSLHADSRARQLFLISLEKGFTVPCYIMLKIQNEKKYG